MKLLVSSVIALILAMASHASFAQKQTFDIITYTPPAGWKMETRPEVVGYSIIENARGIWCQIGIYKSIASTGSIESDFAAEWEMMAKRFKPSAPQANSATTAGDWTTKSGSARFRHNNADATVMLTAITGHNVRVSIVATTNSEHYFDQIQALIRSVELKKPEAQARTVAQPATGTPNAANAAIAGIWIKAGSVSPVYGNPASWGAGGYTKDQYMFNADGTYRFYSKSFGYAMTNLLLAKEAGTFTLNGNSITVVPKASVIESWSKKDNTDQWGRLVQSQRRNLESTTYTFTKHYFSGIQQWNLVLQAASPTQRDGSFSGNTTFRNAYYYAPASANNTAIHLPPGAEIVQ